MQIANEITYSAGPDVVSAMTFQPAFQERKCQNTGATSWTVDVDAGEPGGTGPTTVTTTRDMPTDQFPDFVKSMVGNRLKITEIDRWDAPRPDGGRDGTITVTVDGAPLRFTGTLLLEAAADGSRATIDGELKAGIPFLGARIEQAAAPAIIAAVRAEQRTANDWLT
jgi:Protein of unknown function (DUF2505)